jgi:hypothetical protein
MKLVLALLLIGVVVVGALVVVGMGAGEGAQDAQAQRIAAEAARVRAAGEADALRTRAGAEAAAERADALNRQLVALFPWLTVIVLGLVAGSVAFYLINREVPAGPQVSQEVLLLAALGRLMLEQGRVERWEVDYVRDDVERRRLSDSAGG